MIIFLNFAPIEFMGGAEKWMLDMAAKVNEKEETVLIDVSRHIANVYGKLVLHRTFSSHIDKNQHRDDIKKLKRITLTAYHFLPFTKQWSETRRIFKNARLVYVKFELLEVLISLYFNGWTNVKKTIAGLHSPFRYQEPLIFFEYLHNIVYQSLLSRYYLAHVKKVHILNHRDEQFFRKVFKSHNFVKIPNSVSIPKLRIKQTSEKILQIIFFGELSLRKGTNTLISIIKESPKHFSFHIAGDGSMKKDILDLTREYNNCLYYGYLEGGKLSKLYLKSDVLLFPSRAESLSLVMLEAIAFGLSIVDSKEVSLQLPSFIETSITIRDPKEYVKALEAVYENKKRNKIDNNKIRQYAYDHFSSQMLDPMFEKQILDIK